MFQREKIQNPNTNGTCISIPHSLFTTDVNIFKKCLFPKASFPLFQKKMDFQMFEKDREPCDFPIKGPIQPTWQPPPVPGLETARLLGCHFVRLVGKWRSCCQMDYCTILVPKRDVKSCRVVARCSRKKIVSFCNEFTHTAQNAKTLIFQQRNAK